MVGGYPLTCGLPLGETYFLSCREARVVEDAATLGNAWQSLEVISLRSRPFARGPESARSL